MSDPVSSVLPAPEPGGAVDWPATERLLGLAGSAGALAATPQDPVFHAEGDVWTHTRMALEALVAGPAYAAASQAERAILFAAVLFHDVGKPLTTSRAADGRITSRGHSARGASLLRPALWRAGIPFGVREHVCALARHHQVPFHGLSRSRTEEERRAVGLSLVARIDLLCAVADADARGRRCADAAAGERLVQEVALWREHCEELGVLTRPFLFPSDHTRVVYFESAEGSRRTPAVAAHDDCRAEVVVLSGLPGAGKDHWLRAHRPGLPVISLDALRAELGVDPAGNQGAVLTAARERARIHLRAGQPFAWNATNVSAEVRGQVIGLLRDYRARVHVVYVEAAEPDQRARNRAREAAVPRAAVERMLARWSVPTPLEAHRVTYMVPDAGEPSWPPTP